MESANEYEKLLHYLEQQNVSTNVTTKKTKEERKEEIKKEKASVNTKKLLDESAIEEFKSIPHTHGQSKGSDGFSVLEFESIMRSKLIEQYKTQQSYERPYISVSELYSCLRQCYYARKRYQIDITSQFKFSYLYLIQKVGGMIDDIIQDLYHFSEVEKTIVSEKYKVKGRIDAIRGTNLYEIKSIDDGKLKNSKFIIDHYYQGLLYAYILITEYDYKIDKITIIYVYRSLKKIEAIDLDVDMRVARNLIERAPILLTSLENNIVPEPIGSTADACKWCPYIHYCKKDGYKTIKPSYIKKETVKKEDEKKDDPFTAFLL
jgi:hypothetical protein